MWKLIKYFRKSQCIHPTFGKRHIRGNLFLPKCFLSVEVALLCDAGERERWLMQRQKALGMARQVHGKPLEASQPDGAFRPADLASCCRDQQLSNLERGLGCSAGG